MLPNSVFVSSRPSDECVSMGQEEANYDRADRAFFSAICVRPAGRRPSIITTLYLSSNASSLRPFGRCAATAIRAFFVRGDCAGRRFSNLEAGGLERRSRCRRASATRRRTTWRRSTTRSVWRLHRATTSGTRQPTTTTTTTTVTGTTMTKTMPDLSYRSLCTRRKLSLCSIRQRLPGGGASSLLRRHILYVTYVYQLSQEPTLALLCFPNYHWHF